MTKELPSKETMSDISICFFSISTSDTITDFITFVKTPSKSFPVKNNPDKDLEEICVREMQLALDISQSTTSQHLSILEDAGLLSSKKIGGFSCFKRNEAAIKQLADYILNKI
ncbi:ArsR family transcriptional regulator [Paenibacillus amylolyticus]|uniref:ArsR/SmtB family transcription factor n=1 Tax=Paenibacillus amylolyticus TaxID=1451 RepID=UPI00324240B6